MSTTVVNIIAPGAAIGAVASSEAAAGPLGAFEAVMSAFFAGVDGSAGDQIGGSPFAAEGRPDPARHNLDVSKLPTKAHPAKLAANMAAGQPVGDAGLSPVVAADILADGFVDAAVAPPVGGEAVTSEGEAATDGELSVAAASDALPFELAMSVQAPGAPAAPIETEAAAETDGDAASPALEAQLSPPAPGPTEPQPSPLASGSTEPRPSSLASGLTEAQLPSEPTEAPSKAADKDDKPKTNPGVNASDSARLHAAPNSAVARAAALPQPVPASPPVPEAPAPPPGAAELAVAETQAPSPEPASTAPAARKSNDKPVRAHQAAPSLETTPQDPAAAPTDASGSSEAPSTGKAPKLPTQAADAPRAQPAQSAQSDEPSAATPAEPSARAQAATPSAPAEAAPVRGSPETVASLSAQIVKKLGARSTHFDVQLDPAGLGKVNVRVAINADGQVSAAMRFDNPQAAAELRSRAGELQRALAQSGFDVAGGLSFDVAQDQGGGYGGQQNAFFNDDNPGHAFRGRAFAAALETAGDAVQAALPGAFSPARGVAQGVDVRV